MRLLYSLCHSLSRVEELLIVVVVITVEEVLVCAGHPDYLGGGGVGQIGQRTGLKQSLSGRGDN